MKTVTIEWRPAQMRFDARGGHPGQAIAINAPHDGVPTGFSASELLLAGAGGCSAWDVIGNDGSPQGASCETGQPACATGLACCSPSKGSAPVCTPSLGSSYPCPLLP
jgi:hypothetical protein